MAFLAGSDKRMWAWLVESGIVAEEELQSVRRVIIDIDCRGITTIYKESYADTSMFEIAPIDMSGARVIRASDPVESKAE